MKIGFVRTSHGNIRGVEMKGEDYILLCCNHSIFDDLTGDEVIEKVRELNDFAELLKAGDYVNGLKVCEVRGDIIICNDYRDEIRQNEIIDVVTKERFESEKFIIQRALDRAKELEQERQG